MAEIEIGGNRYRTRKLNAFQQLYVIKRLAGAARTALSPDVLKAISQTKLIVNVSEDGKESIEAEDPLPMLMPFVDGFGKMADEDARFIVMTCLSACQRYAEAGKMWHPVVAGENLMYADMSSFQMLQLTFLVLREDLGGFFDELRCYLEAESKGKEAPNS